MTNNAIQLLTKEHQQVKRLLQEIDATSERAFKKREALFSELVEALQLHETEEEKVFYPALQHASNNQAMVLEAYEEHHLVDKLIAELKKIPYDDKGWTAKFTVLKENLEHHINEEESDLFPQAEKDFSEAKLSALAQDMQTVKEERVKH